MLSGESFSEEGTDSSDDSSESSGSEYNDEDNECGECGGIFVEGELWVQCDVCSKWFHAECTDQAKKRKKQIQSITSWKCKQCSKK